MLKSSIAGLAAIALFATATPAVARLDVEGFGDFPLSAPSREDAMKLVRLGVGDVTFKKLTGSRNRHRIVFDSETDMAQAIGAEVSEVSRFGAYFEKDVEGKDRYTLHVNRDFVTRTVDGAFAQAPGFADLPEEEQAKQKLTGARRYTLGLLAHESAHALQFEDGRLAFLDKLVAPGVHDKIAQDRYDEYEGYLAEFQWFRRKSPEADARAEVEQNYPHLSSKYLVVKNGKEAEGSAPFAWGATADLKTFDAFVSDMVAGSAPAPAAGSTGGAGEASDELLGPATVDFSAASHRCAVGSRKDSATEGPAAADAKAGDATGTTDPASGAPATTAAPVAPAPLPSDAQLLDAARGRVPAVPNSLGVEPQTLSDEEIRQLLEPMIAARVAKLNRDLASRRIRVNADLQYSGPGIRTTGLPRKHDRHAMWLTRFPDLRGEIAQAAQTRYDQTLRDEVTTLVGQRDATRARQEAERAQQEAAARQAAEAQAQQAQAQAQAQQAQAQAETAAAAPNPANATAAGQTVATASTPARAEPPAPPPDSPDVKAARRVIEEYDQRAGGSSGIRPSEFLEGITVFNATNPNKLDISLPSLIQLVKLGRVKSKIPPPELAQDLGPDGEKARSAIDEFDGKAGGKSNIKPADFLKQRDIINATNPVPMEIDVPGLVRLIRLGRVKSDVEIPKGL